MIKYNLQNISDWNFGDDNIIKVYYDNAVCYYKVISSGDTPTFDVCYAVVNDISQYQETEFEDVFNKSDNSWYKLNNLSQYEKYGLYGSGLTTTYYEGKLTIYDGYEYIYSGGSWVNLGEVSGSTATLPNVPFTINYNAKNFDQATQTFAKTEGQLANVDAIVTAGTVTYNSDGYVSVNINSKATIIGYDSYFNRSSSAPNLTIISKQLTDGNKCHLLANRKSNYNWMYRAYNNRLTLHGASEQGGVAVTQQPVIESVRVDSNSTATYNNYTDNTSSTNNNFDYGSSNSGGVALFAGYVPLGSEYFKGDFYWIYMSQNTLTDEQVQQVIDYNEGNGGTTIYPLEYTVKSDPPDNVTFSSMTEAEEYECPWWGMTGIIDNTDYLFCDSNEWLTKYSYQEVSGEYICEMGNKYKKMQEYDRNVDGTMSATTNYVKGDLIESGSPDCTDFTKEYLTFEPISSAVTFKNNRQSFQYSFDDGETWATLTAGNTVTVDVGQKIKLKATFGTSQDDGTNSNRFITSGGTWKAYGNILSIQNGDNFTTATTINGDTLHWLFYQCSDLVDIDDLKIPVTVMNNHNSLRSTFRGCGFSRVPADLLISATTLTASQCYMGMFEDCTNLLEAPILPAASIPSYGYFAMFNNCTSLTGCTCLATSNIGSNRTQLMLNGVASNGVFTKHPNATWSSGQYGYPSGWTVQDYSE